MKEGGNSMQNGERGRWCWPWYGAEVVGKCCGKARKDRGGVRRRRVKNVGSLQIQEQGTLKGFHIIKKKSELLHEQNT